jgi:hypothetical protein
MSMGAYGHEWIVDGVYDDKSFHAIIALNGGVNVTYTVDCANGVTKTFTKDLAENATIVGNISAVTVNSGAGELLAYYQKGEAE